MYSSFYQEHEVFIDNVHKLVRSEFTPKIRNWESEGRFPDEVFTILGEQGYLGILVPEEYGGISGDYKLAAAWCEAFGELCDIGLTVAVNMHSLVICHAVAKYATQSIKENWLPKAMTGKTIGAYAFTEPGCGSDLASLRTTAKKDGENWILNGSKTFITNGARADFVLVLARTDPEAGYKGFTTFFVDTKTLGFKVSRTLDKLGWRSSDTAELSLENVSVPESCVLGSVGEGWFQASDNLNWERMMLTLTSLGGARACLKEAFLYANNRKAFGKSISEFGTISELLAEMYRRIVAAEAGSQRVIDMLTSGTPCKRETSLLKRAVCEDAVWISDRAIQIHGGYGYTTEFNAERWWRDQRLMTIGGGTSEIMAEVVRKEWGRST